MNQAAHAIGAIIRHNEAAVTSFTDKQRCLTAIKLLCQLTRAVQHHRGASMAFLGGEQVFMPQLHQLQEDVHNILVLLKNTVGGHSLQPDEFTYLSTNWETILVGWQNDQIMHNFEFHSHVVDQLKKLLRQCRKTLMPSSEHHHFARLLRFLLDNLFDNIESLAKLRGLSTNAAIVRACGVDAQSRISFLLKEIPEQNQQIMTLLDDLKPFYSHLPTLEQLKLQEKTLHRLLLSIQIQILDTPDITINGPSLFNLATDIINTRWRELGQGLQIIDQSIFDDLVFGSP